MTGYWKPRGSCWRGIRTGLTFFLLLVKRQRYAAGRSRTRPAVVEKRMIKKSSCHLAAVNDIESCLCIMHEADTHEST